MKSKYKYVIYSKSHRSKYKPYQAKIKGEFCCTYATEKEAAIAIDKYLILKGENPINILKKL